VGAVAALLLAAGVTPRSAQAAPSLAAMAEIEVAGGHDDNMFLSATPDGLGSLLRLGGGYVSVAPAIGGELGAGGFRLRLAYFGDFRAAEAVGRLDTQLVDLRGFFPAWGPLRAHLALFGGQFGATNYPGDRYQFGGGELGLRLAIADGFALALVTRAELRVLAPDAAGVREKDRLLASTLRLPYQPFPWLEIAPSASAVLVAPVADGMANDFRRLRAGIDGTVTAGIFTASAGGWLGTVAIGDVSETHTGGRVEVRIDLGNNLQLFALNDVVSPISAGATFNYARRLYAFGIAGRMAVRTTPRRSDATPDLRPRIEQGRVRFRMAARGARSVALVGSWNDWAAPGEPLAATGDAGIWEIAQPLPRGEHRYHFLVDGEARRPPDAPRYVQDGFGSEDGVVDVEAAPESAK
jgi:hypothetical protein